MADTVDFGSEEKPSYANIRTQQPTARPELDHEQPEHTDSSSLSEHKPSPDLIPTKSHPHSRHTLHSRASSADTDPLEPLEPGLSTDDDDNNNNISRVRTGATAATTTSTWSRPPDFEVSFDDDDDAGSGVNPKDWPRWYRIWVLFVLSFDTWVVVLYSTAYTAAIPGLMAEFGEPNEVVATLGVTTFLLGLAVGSLIVAPMSELFGRRPVYLICLTVSMLLVIPVALATSLEGVIVIRFFGALFGAVMVCTAAGSVADVSTEDDRALYMSLWSIGPLNGPVTGPLIGGFVYQYLGWRWDMWLVLILTGIATLLMFTVKETYVPALLKKKAAKMRKDENDERYWCEYDDATRSTAQLMRISLGRPFVLSLTEPILWFFNIWISVIYGILYLVSSAAPLYSTAALQTV